MKKLLDLKNYNFQLPPELIAQKPANPADTCRLLVLDKEEKTIKDEKFLNLPNYLQKGDVLIFNNSKVIPARLIGKKETGGKVEILLLKQINTNTWECLVGNLPVKKQIGTKIIFPGMEQRLHSTQKNDKTNSPSLRSSLEPLLLAGKIIAREKNTAHIKFSLSGKKLMEKIFQLGQMPTPPYIKRLAKETEYQNIFADPKKIGSVAAPTAGLHFTKRIFKKLKQKGVQIEFVTLHVGLGTFAPIKEKDISQHQIHQEYFELDKATARRLNQAKKEGRRIIAVGTTSVRVLETCADQHCHSEHSRRVNADFLMPQKGFTSIYIYPPYKFKFVDAMITNFHLPQSSLILLVSAFAGTKFIKKAYQQAINKKYRFYSFGDVMLIN